MVEVLDAPLPRHAQKQTGNHQAIHNDSIKRGAEPFMSIASTSAAVVPFTSTLIRSPFLPAKMEAAGEHRIFEDTPLPVTIFRLKGLNQQATRYRKSRAANHVKSNNVQGT